jgi:hypothetical protein
MRGWVLEDRKCGNIDEEESLIRLQASGFIEMVLPTSYIDE